MPNYDIIAITETWLEDKISDQELEIPDYNIIRCDRSIFTSHKTGGGGVLLAIKKNIKYSIIESHDLSFEQISLKIFLGSTSLFLTLAYLPPDTTSQKFYNFVDSLTTSILNFLSSDKLKHDILVLGDYNISGYEWLNLDSHSISLGYNIKPEIRDAASFFTQLCESFHLHQINNVKNYYGNILDLVITNNSDITTHISKESIFKSDAAHSPIEVIIPYSEVHQITSNEQHYMDFKNANYSLINKALSKKKFIFETADNCDVNKLVNNLYDTINPIISEYVQKKVIKENKFPKWFSNELKNVIIEKKITHKYMKISDSIYLENKFKSLRAESKKLLDRDDKLHSKKAEDSLKTNSKNFFKYINEIEDKKTSYPDTMHLGSTKVDNKQDIADLFAKKFSSVYRYSDLSTTPDLMTISERISDITIEPAEVKRCILNLKQTSNSGPDGISDTFITNCLDFFCAVLTIIFNKSLATGTFPSKWKISYIIPLFKNGDLSDINNYRPIIKYNNFVKIFEQVIQDKLIYYFSPLITIKQHGYFSGRSTVTNLTTYIEYLSRNINKDSYVDSIYTDLSRAFDSVNTNLLIRKLQSYGIQGTLLNWFSSLLQGREQSVKIGNFTSNKFQVSSGVGQGSHLAPLLFSIYINDIVSCVKYSELLLFADDLKLFKSIKTQSDISKLQEDLNCVNMWCILNDLHFNPLKCFSISFGYKKYRNYVYKINNRELNSVSHIRDLGVFFDEDLSFDIHVDYIVNLAKRRINFLYRYTKSFNKPETFRSLYYAYVYPILSYCSIVWNNLQDYQIYKLEKVLHKFLRIAGCRIGKPVNYFNHDYSNICTTLSIPNLESSRTRADLIFVVKLLYGVFDNSQLLDSFDFYIAPRVLRNNNRMFNIPLLNVSALSKSPIVRLSKLCNENIEFVNSEQINLHFLYKESKKLLIFK